ncbi:aminotransferase class V-fold PLP-dependent enzyme, partial [Candidatus Babeliales bacterium]|nr:aminotransferase class V-fold PLP-dependent enzyme [Candidatus Babeliales bacterium]
YWAPLFLKKGDEIIITIAEHHSNFLPWQRLAEQVGATLTIIPYDQERGRLDLSSIKITEKTKIVAVSHCSNVLGPIWDEKADELGTFLKQAQAVGAFTLLDAAQSMPHWKLDVKKLPVDAAVFSAHKSCGPTGVGALFLRKKWHDELPPFFVGGGMVNRASVEGSSWLPAPIKFEAGTPAIVQAISWGASLDFLDRYVIKNDKKKFFSLTRYLVEELLKISDLKILGNADWIKKLDHLSLFIFLTSMHTILQHFWLMSGLLFGQGITVLNHCLHHYRLNLLYG